MSRWIRPAFWSLPLTRSSRAAQPKSRRRLQPPPPAAAPAAQRRRRHAGAHAADRASLPAISQVPATGTPIVLEAGKGTLIRLSQPAATVFIANPDIADVQVKSPSLIYVSAKPPGETVVYAVDADDNVLLNSPVRVEHDLSRVRESMHALMPGENIAVTSVDNSLVLSGDVSTAGRAEKARALAASIAGKTSRMRTVVNQLAVDTPNQVNLRVKIAEVNRTALKALGFNWERRLPLGATAGILAATHQFLATANPFTTRRSATRTPSPTVFALPGTARDPGDPRRAGAGKPDHHAGRAQPDRDVRPDGELPRRRRIPGAGRRRHRRLRERATITVEFKKFGVALDFTPTIIDANHLSLKVRPEVSQLTSTGAVSVPITSTATVTIPALTVRRAETTVELASGESFALAGLLQNTTEQDISKIPVARRRPDPRPAVPLEAVPAQRDRARHHRHPLSGEAVHDDARRADRRLHPAARRPAHRDRRHLQGNLARAGARPPNRGRPRASSARPASASIEGEVRQ